MNLELSNKVVVISGGTGGIGRQIVSDFLFESAIVVCLIRDEKKMTELREELEVNGQDTSNLFHYMCDLLDYKNIKETIKKIVAQLKTIDILINCSGTVIENPFGLLNENQITELIDVNLKSPLLLTHAILRPMFKQKSGCIINISSVSTIKKGRGIVTYASAKAGLESFTRTLSQEVGRKNIRVNCIRPGVIKTSMSGGVIDRLEDKIVESTALGRVGYTNEISKAALFIASEKMASYMSGECITIDGGLH